jgi:integrase
MLPAPTRRVRWIKPNEAERLIKALPEHQAYAVRFALATGLRQGNIKTLEWSQVSIERSVCWIYADKAKAGKPIHIPLNSEALTVLKALKGKHPDFVFTFRGNPIGQLTTKAWYKALKKTGIESFRWHDLRHTWASWHVQNGTPINVLQELGAWESTEMVRRYAHLGQTHLAQYCENSCQLEK